MMLQSYSYTVTQGFFTLKNTRVFTNTFYCKSSSTHLNSMSIKKGEYTSTKSTRTKIRHLYTLSKNQSAVCLLIKPIINNVIDLTPTQMEH